MPWLLLRGLGREQRHFRHFADALRSRPGSEPVVLLDLAGTGTEWRRKPEASVPWLARDIAARLGGLAPGHLEWSVLGLSLGGMVALELCRLWPDRMRCCIVVNSSARLTSSPLTRLRPAALAHLLAIAATSDRVAREARLLRLTSERPSAERARWAGESAHFARDAPVSLGALSRQLCAAARFVPPVPADVPAPLLFLLSRRDRMVSPEASRALARYYAAPWEEHPWAGHDLPFDDPAWVCERALRFREHVHRAVTEG